MVVAVLSLSVFGGFPSHCSVVIRPTTYAAPAYIAPTAYVNPTYYQTPYTVNSALAFSFEDPDKSSLQRQNERLTETNKIAVEALVRELQNVRAEKNAGGVAASDPGSVQSIASSGAAARAILTANCMSCHSGEKFKGGFKLALPKDGDVHPLSKILINQVVNVRGTMPPKSQRQLSVEEKKVIGEFGAVSIEELKIASK